MDNDGDIDVLSANPGSNTIAIYENSPEFHFSIAENSHFFSGSSNFRTPATSISDDRLTYDISGVDSTLFRLSPGGGFLIFSANPNFEAPHDSNRDNIYNFMTTASDRFGNSTTISVIVTVTDVQE